MYDTRNKRKFERYNPTGMAIWVRQKGMPEVDAFPVDITNISAGGARCLLPFLPDVGSLLEIDFELPQYTEIIQALAVVSRVDGQEEGHFITGIEFLEVLNLDQEELFQFLAEVLK